MDKLDQVPLRSPSEGELPQEYQEVFASKPIKKGSVTNKDIKKFDKISAKATASVPSQRSQTHRDKIEKENKIDTVKNLYTKQELDMLK